VELADVLFRRSRVFRGLLAPRLAAFLVRMPLNSNSGPYPVLRSAACRCYSCLRFRALLAPVLMG
jgi:hypothetical protein